jgi:integrase
MLGRRKYLTAGKRKAFLAAVERAPRRVRTLCVVLAHTECRISESLEMTARRIDIEARTIIFESLENRRGALTGPFWCPPPCD